LSIANLPYNIGIICKSSKEPSSLMQSFVIRRYSA